MNKEEKQGLIILGVLITMIGVLITFIVITVKANNIKFEYYRNGKFGISNKCYQSEKGECLCKIDGNFLSVDSYYEVEK